jgi:biotin carboxyl carrier protein
MFRCPQTARKYITHLGTLTANDTLEHQGAQKCLQHGVQDGSKVGEQEHSIAGIEYMKVNVDIQAPEQGYPAIRAFGIFGL